MPREFAIGDIHGCCETFKKLLLEEIQIRKSDRIYCIGDYVDRGPDSKGVIDFITGLRKQGYNLHTLRGNHEQMMLDAFQGEFDLYNWLKNGGGETLNSFGLNSLSELPINYVNFLKNTKYYIKKNKYLLVHAGLNFNRDDFFEDKDAMLWVRDFSDSQPKLQGKKLLHGHTPKSIEFILKQDGNCFNIDGGCVFKDHKNLGKLIAYNLNEEEFIWIDNCD